MKVRSIDSNAINWKGLGALNWPYELPTGTPTFQTKVTAGMTFMVLTMIARYPLAITTRKCGGKNKIYYLQALEASSEVTGRKSESTEHEVLLSFYLRGGTRVLQALLVNLKHRSKNLKCGERTK